MKLRPSILLASISALVASTTAVHAVDYNWNVGSGDWADPGSWAGGVVPTGGGGNFAYISNGGTATISSNTNAIQDPLIGRGGGSVGTVNQTAGILNASAGWAFIGDGGGTGTYNMSGASVINTGRMYVGKGGGSNGTFSTSSTGTNTIDRVIIGSEGGTGNASVTGGGSFRANNQLYIGGQRDAGGGTGTFTVNTTGTLSSGGDFSIGSRGGNGTLNVQAGTVNAASWMIIGETVNDGGGSTGVVNQTGGIVGNGINDGNGRFWMGTRENNAGTASTATYNLSGGTLNARNAAIGRTYTGTINQTGGIANFNGSAQATNLGEQAGSTGIYNLSGGTLNTVAGTFNVGDSGTGSLNVSGTGVANITGGDGLRLGASATGNGTLNLNGGMVSANFINRPAGAGQVNLNGGTLQARTAQASYFQNLSDAQINVQSGGLTFDTNSNAVTITQNLAGAGGLTKVGNGTLSITGAPTYAGATTVNGGVLSIGNGGTTGSLPGTANIGAAGTLALNRSDDVTNTNTITGSGSYAKNGANTLTVAGGFSGFTGALNVNGGKLVNTAAGDLASAGLSVNSGATLLPLGGAVGAINAASVTIGAGSTLNFDFSAGGATFDQIVSSGGITFGGAYTVNLFDVGTANAFSTNGTYSLFDYATTVTGSPSGFTIGNAVAGKSYQLANNLGDTTLRMSIADAVLVQWNQAGGGLWSTNTNWTPNITPNVATADVNFVGSITAPSTVDINGNKTSGKLTFDNANTYTVGGAGTLTLDNGLAAGSIAVVTGNHFINTPLALPNATGVSTATGTALQLGDISGTGAITKTGNGTLTLNGTTGSTGGMIVGGGLVQVGTGGASGVLPAGNISLAAGTRISLNSTANVTVANNISGGGSISQDAASVVTHTGTSTYTGFTDLNVGTFNNNGSIVGTSNIDVNNTTNLGAASTTTTPGAITVGTGGTLTSSGAVSYGTRLTVNDGASATISGGTFTQTAPATETGFYIGENGAGTLNISSGTSSAFDIWVGRNNGAVGNINLSGGRLDSNQWTSIATNGGSTGTITQTAGTLNQNHTDWLSVGESGVGTYTMSGSSILNDQSVVDTSARGTNKGNIVIGRRGGSQGTWTLNDSSVARIRELLVGNESNTTGTVNINGMSSVTSSYDLHIGNAGTGTVNVNGGSLITTSGWTQIGMATGGNGTLNVTAGTVYNREMRVGINSPGTVDISGGTVTANQAISLGVNPTGNGTLIARGTAMLTVDNGGINVGAPANQSAGTGTGLFTVANSALVNISGGLQVGGTGFGTYNQTGGTVNVNGNAVFGNGGPNAAYANVGGGSLAVNGELWVGQAANGNATMNISAGTVSANNWIAVGRQNATGVINISDTGSLIKTGANHLVVGSLSGIGSINQLGGTFNTAGAGEVRLGENAGGQGTWNMAGGTASTDAISVGWSGGGTGNLNISDTANLIVGAGGLRIGEGGPGTVAVTGGTLTVNGNLDVQGGAGGTFAIAGGRVNVNGGIDTSNGTFNFGAGTLSRSNAGLIDINGPLTTADAASTLKLDTDKTFDISGAFDNTPGLTLDLSGMGIPDGTFLGVPITGTFSLGVIGGAITLGGDAFDITHTSLFGFDPVFDLGSGPLTATRINDETPFNANSDSVYWIDQTAGAVTVKYNVVPEPSSVALMIGGLVVLARRRRRA